MKEALGKPRCLQYLVMASSSHRQTPSTFAVEAHDRFNMWKAAFWKQLRTSALLEISNASGHSGWNYTWNIIKIHKTCYWMHVIAWDCMIGYDRVPPDQWRLGTNHKQALASWIAAQHLDGVCDGLILPKHADGSWTWAIFLHAGK